METAILCRVAEALRRSQVEQQVLAGAIREEVYKGTIEMAAKTCNCAATAALTLKIAPPRDLGHLDERVDEAIKALKRGQPVRMSDDPIGQYAFQDRRDVELAQAALDEGRENITSFTILRKGGALEARTAALYALTDQCPTLMTAPTATITVPTALAGPPDAGTAKSSTDAQPKPHSTALAESPDAGETKSSTDAQPKPQPGASATHLEGEGES
jgi:hypothetical protein